MMMHGTMNVKIGLYAFCSEHLIINRILTMLHESVHWNTSVLSLANIIMRLFQTSPKEPNTSNFPLYSSSHLFIKFTSSFPRLFLSCTHTHTHTHTHSHTHTLSLNLFPSRTSDGSPSPPSNPPPTPPSTLTIHSPPTPPATLSEFVKCIYIYTKKQLDHFTLYLRPYLSSTFFLRVLCQICAEWRQ
jgi:hypothetical protein